MAITDTTKQIGEADRRHVRKLLRQLVPGDVLIDGIGRPALVVERVQPSRAAGYLVVTGTATATGRALYPHGQTSGHRDRVVTVVEA